MATQALVNALADDAETARETLRQGMQGFASKEQLMAAREVINALASLDKMTRLDAGAPTEITETRSLDAVASDFDALLREVASNPPEGVKRG